MSHLRFDEEDSDYNPSDSDDDYNENEKILLNKVRNRRTQDSDNEEEVFGVGSEDDDDDDDQSDIAVSDVEGQDDKDELPDVRAWGKKKSKFYNTDYVDQDYGGFQSKDAHLAQLEEEEARNLQKQLAQQLDDDDFQLDFASSKRNEDDKKAPEEVIKSDISTLSKRQKLAILQKESPEFFGLVEDFQTEMAIVRDFLSPVLTGNKSGRFQDYTGLDFIKTHYKLIMNYCINIYMYMLLKASRVSLHNHPIVKRLYQYRQLLSQMTPVFEKTIKSQIEVLLQQPDTPQKPKKTLNVLKKLSENPKKKKKPAPEGGHPEKKVKFDEQVEEHLIEESEEPTAVEPDDTVEDGVAKRAITYQIAKNKGLTPHRKKEQRNPRVKHRNKFRKAKVRRRGAVREPRTEMTRYSGEISGIKSSVTKSIKIKS